MNRLKGNLLPLLLAIVLLAWTSALQAQSIQTIGINSPSLQRVSNVRVSSVRLSGNGSSSGSASFNIRHRVEEVRGSANKPIVLTPQYRGTFVLQAQYLTPNPANEKQPFTVKSESLRLPLPNQQLVYWVPNQTTKTFTR